MSAAALHAAARRTGPGRGGGICRVVVAEAAISGPESIGPPYRPCADPLDSFALDRGISPMPADHESHRGHSVFSWERPGRCSSSVRHPLGRSPFASAVLKSGKATTVPRPRETRIGGSASAGVLPWAISCRSPLTHGMRALGAARSGERVRAMGGLTLGLREAIGNCPSA